VTCFQRFGPLIDGDNGSGAAAFPADGEDEAAFASHGAPPEQQAGKGKGPPEATLSSFSLYNYRISS
jgi:hypothetical protein